MVKKSRACTAALASVAVLALAACSSSSSSSSSPASSAAAAPGTSAAAAPTPASSAAAAPASSAAAPASSAAGSAPAGSAGAFPIDSAAASIEGATAPGATPASLTTVTFAVNSFIGVAPLYLGVAQGFFAQNGINLKLTSIPSTPAVLQAVVSKQSDLGFGLTPSVMTADSKGANVKCVGPFSGTVSTDPAERSTAIVVENNSPIKTVADLAGKKVAVGALGGEQAVLTQEAVDNAGGDWKSVKLVPLAFGVMNTSIKSGAVDAIATTEPFLDQAVAAGGHVLSWIETQYLPHYSMTCAVANDAFITAHPDLVTAFQKAMAESLTYSASHISDIRASLPKILGITAAAAATTPLGVDYTPNFNLPSVSAVETLMVKYGYIPSTIPLNQLLDYPGVS